jgi:hypothetical protein
MDDNNKTLVSRVNPNRGKSEDYCWANQGYGCDVSVMVFGNWFAVTGCLLC